MLYCCFLLLSNDSLYVGMKYVIFLLNYSIYDAECLQENKQIKQQAINKSNNKWNNKFPSGNLNRDMYITYIYIYAECCVLSKYVFMFLSQTDGIL